MTVGTQFVSTGSGVTLTVAETFADGTFFATQDGKTFERGVWHDGAETDTVWAEVWRFGTRLFHGTVDSVSRRVTQVG